MLTVDESLKKLNIPVADFSVASNIKEAGFLANKYKFPVVLKLISSKIIHKTDVGGVKIVKDKKEFINTAKKFLKKGRLLVQKQVDGVEFFLGIKKDASFGHVLLAGLGGIFVEVYKDISFRVCPITKKDAREMLDELKGRALLEGIRGRKPVNKNKLIDVMVKLSHLPEKLPGIQELDINPLFVNDKDVKAVDARLELR